MARKVTDELRELILADHHTGHYTQRQLADKYNVSVRTINLIVKGVVPKYAEEVNAEIKIQSKLAQASKQEVNAIYQVVEEKTRYLRLINNLTIRNLSMLAKKIASDITIIEHKLVQDTIDKAAITLGVADRHAKQININAQQNNMQVEGFEFDVIEV